MTDIKYDWDIPLPSPKTSRGLTSRMGRIRTIPVGASLLFPASNENVDKEFASIRGAAWLLTKRELSKPKYASRKVEGGVRVWRIS